MMVRLKNMNEITYKKTIYLVSEVYSSEIQLYSPVVNSVTAVSPYGHEVSVIGITMSSGITLSLG